MAAHDLVVIGGGPAGYVAAIRAAQLGLDTACVDAGGSLGGTCLNVGCIPAKALLESSLRYRQAREELAGHGVRADGVELDLPAMLGRKDQVVAGITQGVSALFYKWKIKHYRGRGRLEGPGRVAVEEEGGKTELEAKRIMLATGSRPAALPGIELDGERVITSTESLSLERVPEHLAVIGAGAIGVEMGSVWGRLGAKVTVLEYLDRILPGIDGEIAGAAQKVFAEQGLEFRLGERVTGVSRKGRGCKVELEGGKPLSCDLVLVAVGRKPNTEELGLESAGIETDRRGFIPVDEEWATTAENVYAVGDVIGGAMLAHKASDEAVACVERIVTGHGHINYDAVPLVVYTEPEVAGVGRTEEELKEAGVAYTKGTFPYLANGRARILGDMEGLTKVLARADNDRLLGVHILGTRAGDLVAEAATAIEFGASSEDLARACHAHPTLAETIKEAALAADERAIHL
jgi:dihydrolipoamide dehydrogenase